MLLFQELVMSRSFSERRSWPSRRLGGRLKQTVLVTGSAGCISSVLGGVAQLSAVAGTSTCPHDVEARFFPEHPSATRVETIVAKPISFPDERPRNQQAIATEAAMRASELRCRLDLLAIFSFAATTAP